MSDDGLTELPPLSPSVSERDLAKVGSIILIIPLSNYRTLLLIQAKLKTKVVKEGLSQAKKQLSSLILQFGKTNSPNKAQKKGSNPEVFNYSRIEIFFTDFFTLRSFRSGL